MRSDTKDFLKTLEPKLASQSFSWLGFYFVLAVILHLCLHFFPEFFPNWLKESGFQIFLLGALALLFKQGWRPQLQCSGKSIAIFVGLVLLYFGLLWLLDFGAKLSGYTGVVSIVRVGHLELILLIVVAPVLEEFFFRDYLFRAFVWQMNRIQRAAFFSSAFFMLAHFSLHPGAFVLGIVNCILFASLRSVWPAVAFHALSNLSLFFLPAYFPHLAEFVVALQQLQIQ